MSRAAGAAPFAGPFKLKVQETKLTEEQFVRLCQENPELRIELTAQGELVIMAPTGLETGRRNIRIGRHLDTWAEVDGTGLAFDSSPLFTLPNGAKRSPDASWVRRERWEALPPEQRQGFGVLCPDFVVELRSPTDRLADLQEKLQEYLANGARTGRHCLPALGPTELGRQDNAQHTEQGMLGEPLTRIGQHRTRLHQQQRVGLSIGNMHPHSLPSLPVFPQPFRRRPYCPMRAKLGRGNVMGGCWDRV